jgi:NAD(P)-dependent dehydrogenase (short-subunit alcohol dehydrogenase family)
MWARCLAKEGRNEGINAIMLDPGSVSTDAQETICSTPPENFPSLPIFLEFYENNKILAQDFVAEKGVPSILEHTMEKSGERFNIREMQHT